MWYLGSTIEYEIDKATHKPSKESRRADSARQRVLDKYITPEKDKSKGFADPAAFFG